jgi:hypothetical protein
LHAHAHVAVELSVLANNQKPYSQARLSVPFSVQI